jgi:hypothetical protein
MPLNNESPAGAKLSGGVSEGTRTPDRLDHNQELYQLSYAHRGSGQCSGESAVEPMLTG